MTAAARAPRPSTSPMTMPTRPADSGMMSYQSPPTCVWMPWPCVSSGLAGTYRQATSSPSSLGSSLRQQAGLEGQGGPPLRLEQQRVVDGDRDPAGHRAEEVAVVRVVVLLVPLGQPGQRQADHAEQLAPGDQRRGHDRASGRSPRRPPGCPRWAPGEAALVEVLHDHRFQAAPWPAGRNGLRGTGSAPRPGPSFRRRAPAARVHLDPPDQLVALEQVDEAMVGELRHQRLGHVPQGRAELERPGQPLPDALQQPDPVRSRALPRRLASRARITMPSIAPEGWRSGTAWARTNTREPSPRMTANVPSQAPPAQHLLGQLRGLADHLPRSRCRGWTAR